VSVADKLNINLYSAIVLPQGTTSFNFIRYFRKILGYF